MAPSSRPLPGLRPEQGLASTTGRRARSNGDPAGHGRRGERPYRVRHRGHPPIGYARRIRVVMDPALGGYPVVWAAAGLPTAVFPVAPATLRMLADAVVAPMTDEVGQSGPAGAVRPSDGGGPGFRPGGHRSPRCDRHLPGRAPGSMALGRIRAVGGRLRPHRGRRNAHDLGSLVADDPDARCRAELRIDGPGGAWTVRLASTISDEPAAVLWDWPVLVVKYGFHAYPPGIPKWRPGLEPSVRNADPRGPGVVEAAARPGAERDRDIRDRGGWDRRLANRPFRCRHGRGVGRRAARPDELRRPAQRSRSCKRASRRLRHGPRPRAPAKSPPPTAPCPLISPSFPAVEARWTNRCAVAILVDIPVDGAAAARVALYPARRG